MVNAAFSKLNSGFQIPRIGLGVGGRLDKARTEQAVQDALKIGIRLIDTASMYGNEAQVGNAIRKSGIPRKEMFITTKLYNTEHDDVEGALERSLAKLGTDYVDLYLMHWPVAGKRLDSWKEMARLQKSGLCRSIGVSNFMVRHLEELLAATTEIPSVNQVEFNPFIFDRALLDFCRKKGIILEAYGPLAAGMKVDDKTISRIAKKNGRTNAQIMLKWAFQHDVIPIFSTANPVRMRENIELNFEISEVDMSALDSLNENIHFYWDPTNEL